MTATWAAPGRVNLIGEHVDYNAGLALPFALPLTTVTQATARSDAVVAVTSVGLGAAEFGVAVEPGDVSGWARYVAGAVWALRQRGVDVPGLDLEITSDVPQGAGLSSSAALTCSVAAAVSDVSGSVLTREAIAEVARVAENDFVGVPTGAMDQLASMLCKAGSAVLIDCRSLDVRHINLELDASGLSLLLIDTGVRRALSDSAYADRRRDCELAAAGLGVAALRDAKLEQLAALPSQRLRRRARHVVTEIQRVTDAVAVLADGTAERLGELLTASHASLRNDFEVSCRELDVTVVGALSGGALGGRMVGGGFGGCAIALCRQADEAAVRRSVYAAYGDAGWLAPDITPATPAPGAHRVVGRTTPSC